MITCLPTYFYATKQNLLQLTLVTLGVLLCASSLSAGVLTSTHAGEKRHAIPLASPIVAYQRGTPTPIPPIAKPISKSAHRKLVRKERIENFRVALTDALSKPAQVSPQRTIHTKGARQQQGPHALRLGGVVTGAILLGVGLIFLIVGLLIFWPIGLIFLILGIALLVAGLIVLLIALLR
jgi:F0F1-type ATP synthase assembly protein I